MKWFVGRGDELALLSGLVAGVSAGVGGVVLVEGEQGIGKTAWCCGRVWRALRRLGAGCCGVRPMS